MNEEKTLHIISLLKRIVAIFKVISTWLIINNLLIYIEHIRMRIITCALHALTIMSKMHVSGEHAHKQFSNIRPTFVAAKMCMHSDWFC